MRSWVQQTTMRSSSIPLSGHNQMLINFFNVYPPMKMNLLFVYPSLKMDPFPHWCQCQRVPLLVHWHNKPLWPNPPVRHRRAASPIYFNIADTLDISPVLLEYITEVLGALQALTFSWKPFGHLTLSCDSCRYPQYISKISSRYLQDISKISPRYTQYSPKISPRWPHDTSSILNPTATPVPARLLVLVSINIIGTGLLTVNCPLTHCQESVSFLIPWNNALGCECSMACFIVIS